MFHSGRAGKNGDGKNGDGGIKIYATHYCLFFNPSIPFICPFISFISNVQQQGGSLDVGPTTAWLDPTYAII